MPKLTQKEVRTALTGLRGWKVAKTGKLHREYKFADFMHAFGFMATAALAIERMNHHPVAAITKPRPLPRILVCHT